MRRSWMGAEQAEVAADPGGVGPGGRRRGHWRLPLMLAGEGELEQAVSLHAEQGDASGHVAEAAVWAPPIEALAKLT